MMPFSVLRTWFGGLFSWLVIGVAIYTLWEWADGIDPPPVRQEVRAPQTGGVTVSEWLIPHADSSN